MTEAEESKVTAVAQDGAAVDAEQCAEQCVEQSAEQCAEQCVEQSAEQCTEQKKTRNLRKVMTGVVVSDKMERTLVVKVTRRTTHPLYRKVILVSKKYYVHDENNEAKIGDQVKIMETRPLSKLKRWRLVSIQQRAATE